jgi:hypothetical protein
MQISFNIWDKISKNEKLKKDIFMFKSWTDGITGKCPVCGKEFIKNYKVSNRKIYCSKECRILANKNKKKEIIGQIDIDDIL